MWFVTIATVALGSGFQASFHDWDPSTRSRWGWYVCKSPLVVAGRFVPSVSGSSTPEASRG